jgi:tRNA threonylcarbamoyladenosine biosynthesis protein TsaB
MAHHGSSVVSGPIILALENSSQCGSVALVGEGICLAEYSLTSTITHSRRLLTTIQQIMAETGVTWERIAAIAVSAGPGSFTGLRIGLTTAKGLAMATGKPLISVSATSTLACQLPWTNILVCPVIDARKHEVYTAFYRCGDDGECRRISEVVAISPEELAEGIGEDVIFLGDGSRIYRDTFRERLGTRANFASPEIFFVRAAALGHCALKKWRNQEFIDPATAIPDYIRPSEAEQNLTALGIQKSGVRIQEL